MTFVRLQVQDFQSVAKADLELGQFTVIVGPSNSGKSAVLRALKAVVRNVNSPSSVRAGQKMLSVALTDDSGTTVSIERGKSHSTYRLIPADGEEAVFTKAGRAVPEEIQSALRILDSAGPDLVFSSQIDPPFLLAETGSVAAKMLGDLTNVSKLHAAAREANKRRLEATRMLKVREADAAECLTRLKEIAPGLKEEGQHLSEARAALDEVRAQAQRAQAVRARLESREKARKFMVALETAYSELPQLLEDDDLTKELQETEEALVKRRRVAEILARCSALDTVIMDSTEGVEVNSEQAEMLEQQYHALLEEAGSCPVCGASTQLTTVKA